jgi:hypothetical protein
MLTPRQIGPVRLAFGLVTLFAIGRQLAIHAGLGFGVVNFFSYFTNLSNLLAAAVLLWGAVRGNAQAPASRAFDTIRLLAVVTMTIVGIVFTALLRGADLGSLLPWVNVLLHYVMPIVMLLDWIVVPPARRPGLREWWSCQPVAIGYLLYTMTRGAITGWYPYPFLRPDGPGGHGRVGVYISAILVLFLLIGAGAIAVANASQRIWKTSARTR